MQGTHYLQGAKVIDVIGGDIEVSTIGADMNQWDPSDTRVNWMTWGLPIDESDLPKDYDGGRWRLHTEKYGYDL